MFSVSVDWISIYVFITRRKVSKTSQRKITYHYLFSNILTILIFHIYFSKIKPNFGSNLMKINRNIEKLDYSLPNSTITDTA